MYRSGAILTPAQIEEVRRDFLRFYKAVADIGLRGIRWNFDGCVLCTPPAEVEILQRILFLDPRVVKAAGGRAFGTLLCPRHIDATADEKAAGVLRRIREAPPS